LVAALPQVLSSEGWPEAVKERPLALSRVQALELVLLRPQGKKKSQSPQRAFWPSPLPGQNS
jgi:hypothetical protein